MKRHALTTGLRGLALSALSLALFVGSSFAQTSQGSTLDSQSNGNQHAGVGAQQYTNDEKGRAQAHQECMAVMKALADCKAQKEYSMAMLHCQRAIEINLPFGFYSHKDLDGIRNELQDILDSINGTPRAEVIGISSELDAYHNDELGMYIYASFTVDNMMNQNGRASAYFYYADDTPVLDKNGNYYSTDGQVSVGADFKPEHKHCTYYNLTMFIPYSELHLEKEADIYFGVSIFKNITQQISTFKKGDEIHFKPNAE